MKAIVSNKYGSAEDLELKEVEKPIPQDNQVLVKIHAASLNYGNLLLLKGKPFLARFAFGLLRPKYPIPGGDIAGTIEAVGRNIKKLKAGDEVFGDLSGCGWGGFAEYVSVPEHVLVLKPANSTFEQAAAVPMAGVTALQGLRNKGKIQSGQKVLINGASGGVGLAAVQIAKSYGAEVTGVCSTRNIDILKSSGADHVIDYTKEDFTQKPQRYDLILGVNGYQPISAYKRTLRPNGIYVMIGGSGAQFTQAMVYGPWISLFGSKKMGNMLQRSNQEDLLYLSELLKDGQLKPVIDRCYTLSEGPEAFRYFDEGHARGKVVITM